MKKKHWTDKELAQLKELFPNIATKELIPIFGVSYKIIANKAYELGIKKSQAYKDNLSKYRNELLTKVGEKSRFKKGQAAHNKGKPMQEPTYQKVAKTMFKKGHSPHNTKYDGHLRRNSEGYLEQRVKLGEYELAHRVIWQQHYGVIPEGKIIVFKDKNRNNLSVENLQMIDRTEHMKRNSIYRFPVDLRNAIFSLRKFKKELQQYEKQNH